MGCSVNSVLQGGAVDRVQIYGGEKDRRVVPYRRTCGAPPCLHTCACGVQAPPRSGCSSGRRRTS
eukprot:scaffold90330_cov111-Phaeocystis_antarctica.AAC.2